MTDAETIAFNAGGAVLDLAVRSVHALEPRLPEKPTRFNFAIGALVALADEGRALLLPLPLGPGEPADAGGRKSPPLPAPALMEVANGC